MLKVLWELMVLKVLRGQSAPRVTSEHKVQMVSKEQQVLSGLKGHKGLKEE